MSWKSRAVQATSTPLHLYNRGVDSGLIFRHESDYKCWMMIMANALPRFGIDLLLYSLMPNHYHVSAIQQSAYEVSEYLKDVCWRYAKYFNKKYRRHGPVFSGRFRSQIIRDDAGLVRLSHYIHMNPVTAHLSTDPLQWSYSSCREYLGGRSGSLVKTDMILGLVGGVEEYARFLKEYDPADSMSVFRFLKNGGATI